MESILLLVSSMPSNPNAERAFATALHLRSCGHAVSVCLLQDAVLAGLKIAGNGTRPRIAQALDAGISIYALGEDLALRGFTLPSLLAGVCLADYSQLVDLFEQHTRVIGAL